MNNILQIKKYKFHVHGMHCNSCVHMLESELGELPDVSEIKANLKDKSIEVVGYFKDKNQEDIIFDLNEKLKNSEYIISLEKEKKNKKLSEFKIAIPIAIVFAILFISLQKIGMINIIGSGEVTYGTAFIIGIIASLSSCMAVVGGLLLSMSATFAKDGNKVIPQLMFHVGRITSFFILGGMIGMIGSAFTLNSSATFILSLLIGLVMFILGINLLDVFHFTKKIQPTMPKFISRHIHGISKINNTFTPLIAGVVTFFLPCGFTQSMQIYTLTTGSFINGGLTMLAFALGTFPVLAVISFSSLSINKSLKSGIFFKSAGLIVILFALINIINSFVVIGIIPPIFNF